MNLVLHSEHVCVWLANNRSIYCQGSINYSYSLNIVAQLLRWWTQNQIHVTLQVQNMQVMRPFGLKMANSWALLELVYQCSLV